MSTIDKIKQELNELLKNNERMRESIERISEELKDLKREVEFPEEKTVTCPSHYEYWYGNNQIDRDYF